jgi:hypothetical protein
MEPELLGRVACLRVAPTDMWAQWLSFTHSSFPLFLGGVFPVLVEDFLTFLLILMSVHTVDQSLALCNYFYK